MRRLFFCLVVAGFVFSACSGQRGADSETEFFRDFSLGEIVERVASPEMNGASGSNGYTSSPGIKRRKDFSLVYTIEEGVKFDEVGFITKLKVETERAADDAGVHINGSGLSGDSFHLDYSDEDQEGWLEVVGTRMEGNGYKVWGVIIEKTKSATQ